LVLQSKARVTNPRQREIKPSIDTAAKIAEALSVTIDYLVKEGEYQNIDNETLKRMKQLEKLSPEDKFHVFAMLDAFFLLKINCKVC